MSGSTSSLRQRHPRSSDEADSTTAIMEKETDSGSSDAKLTAGSSPVSKDTLGVKTKPVSSSGPKEHITYQKPFALILIIIAAFGFAFLLRGRSSRLPKTYALCSKEGNIYTVDAAHPRVECVVVHNSRILSVGSLAETRVRFGDAEKTGPAASTLTGRLRSLKNGLKFYFVEPGHIVVPGLADAHAHLIEHGFKRHLEVDNCSSVQDVITKVENYVTARPDVLNDKNIWIQGMGWDQTKWPSSEFPTAADLDSNILLRGRPIVLRRVDGHALWVSSRVLEDTNNLPESVDGGAIVRGDDGKPTGVFVDNAMALIKPPAWTEKEMLEYYLTAVKEALSYGLTSIHDAATLPDMISFLKKMADANQLPLRLYLMGFVESDEYWGDQIERFVNYGPAGRLTLRSVKLFMDGALGSWGAALLEPYTDVPDLRGFLLRSPEAMSQLAKRMWDDGFQVNIHCIGDWANNVVLDIFEDLLRGANVTDRRPRIEHAQIMVPADLERIGRLGVIPSVQPTHATNDMWYAERRLGSKRIKSAYAYKTLLEQSDQHILPLGSDFPVEGVNPLLGFYAAVARLSVDGESPHGDGGWFPEQRLTRAEALKGMTFDPAYASFNEDNLGSLTPGKLADFVVLDTDIMTVPASLILQAKVLATVVDWSTGVRKTASVTRRGPM
ncbi:amidohydrolase family-domain-containing protein [Phellopilus nigrolimitatus]|nr:amidohydrolase family-domain-containing protein [Phellopilus nigrolimitatus]